MKKKLIISLIALMSAQAFAADLRDASFQASSEAGNLTMAAGQSTINESIKIADITAEKLKGLISRGLDSTANVSAQTARAIVQVSEVSQPVLKLTANGLALVFDVSRQSTDASVEVSKKLIILLDPSSRASSKVLAQILEQLSRGSEVSSDVTSKINAILDEQSATASDVTGKILEVLSKVFEKPLDLTSHGIQEINRLLTKGSVTGTEVSNKIIGEENIIAGFKLTGKGISLTSKGIGAVFYFISKATTGISDLFQMNKEEIQKAVERNDQDTLAGLREMIRAEINKSVEGGETINQLLSDEDLDQYIELSLAAMNS